MFHVEQKIFLLTNNNNNSTFSTTSKKVFDCKDHLVSGEEFEIHDLGNGVLKTSPFPGDPGKYYQSENYISHTDSKRNLKDRVYQIVKSWMLKKKVNWIQSFKTEGKILDYGAGTGDFLNYIKTKKWEVVGVEPNTNARKLGISKDLKILADLENLTDKDFDVITLWHVLEHIPDYENIIHQLKCKLKENGLLVIAVPNYRSYDAFYYKDKWAAWDVPRHLWHFSKPGLKSKIEKLGFSFVDDKPLKYDAYYVSMLSEKKQEKKGSIINALFRGFLSNIQASSSKEYSSHAYFFKKA